MEKRTSITELSICFHTDKIRECSEFYTTYFNSKITFECDWYIVVTFENGMYLSFQKEDNGISDRGISLNFAVDDVDLEYQRIKNFGLKIENPIEDHDWGDRAFTMKDPMGNTLYIFSYREMKGEYR